MINNQTKKILFIVQLPPPVHGASVMNSYIVNSELIKNHFLVDIVNLQFAKSFKEIAKFSIQKIFKVFIFGFQIAKKLYTNKPDLVYFTLSPFGYAFYRDAFYVLLLKIFRTKIVFHLHGKGIRENARGNIIKLHLYSWVFKNVSVICLSKKLTSDVENVYKSVPFIVSNGIHLYPEINLNNTQIIESAPKILYLGNYVRSKGVLVLLDALCILKNLGYEFEARFVGAPADLGMDFLENIVRNKKLDNFVKIVGPLYGEDKIKEFENADMFVFPTYFKNEAFPLVILEAMQFSLPVISTFEGGIPDMIVDGESGLLVETKNSVILADKIAVLLKNRDLLTVLGKNGHERFINNFTLSHFETNIYSTFQAILGLNT